MTEIEYKVAIMFYDNTAELLEYFSANLPIFENNIFKMTPNGFKFAILSHKAWKRNGNSIIGLGHTALEAWHNAYKKFYAE